MTYVVREEELDEEVDLTHFGVKGMHWGVRRQESSSGSGTATDSKVARLHEARMQIGKDVALATVAAAGAITVGALAGPIAGAAAGAAIRSVITVYKSDQTKLANITQRANEITKDANRESARLDNLHKALTGGGVKVYGRQGNMYDIKAPSGQRMVVDKSILEDILSRTRGG